MSFSEVLTKIRSESKNTVELGNSFEQVCKIFLENDDLHSQEYEKIWHYKEWAKEYPNFSPDDIGTDLVASIKGSEGKFCAIQCKCFGADHSVTKEDIDTFMSSSESDIFEKRILMDTSSQDLGRHARSAIENSSKEFIRIQSSEFRDSRIDWLSYLSDNKVRLRSKKELRDYQAIDVEAVVNGLEDDDRGKLIMACGTGKTFVSLRIAEKIAGKGKMVLYMVPSLALMSQTIREWKNDASEDFYAFSACSDKKVGKRKQTDDEITIGLNDLSLPATTNPSELSEKIKNQETDKMIVVFSTYQSIDVISSAQYEHNLKEFDLIICDEAHRTTGATLKGDDESNFVKIHDNENIKSKKRLYMTATPRIFGENAKSKAEDADAELASMDDEKIYGKVLAHRGFGWAVEHEHLTDYKVIVLAVDEGIVSQNVKKTLEHQGTELKLDDATKIVGCHKALQKIWTNESEKTKSGDSSEINLANQKPMRRAIAFTKTIALSKLFTEEYSNVIDEYNKNDTIIEEFKTDFEVKTKHVDGKHNAEERSDLLNWLEEEDDENICHILSNARCLSEGVDIPALDAILFLHPKKSQVDIIQAIGRVMRKAEGKDLGYIILPITVPPGVPPEISLNNNESYQVIWQLLNALRAHDERIDSDINRLSLGENISDLERINLVGIGGLDELDATTAVIEDINTNEKKSVNDDKDDEETLIGADVEDSNEKSSINPEQLSFVMSDLSSAIKAKIVEKCGTRDYWEKWAGDIAKIAEQHIKRIKAIVNDKKAPERKIFLNFLEEIRDDLNPEITEDEAVEMLAQHIITKPVFDSLFQGNKFSAENAVSRAMEKILDNIYERNIESEQTDSLKRFYKSVKRRIADITKAETKQTLILQLYDRFFRYAFPKMTQRLGIVYTPTEVVDFIIQSVEDVMQAEFNSSLGNEGAHILDPFTGTGTFISRLFQSGILSDEQIRKKYKSEIHANEIVLLAYYIACINIEAVYEERVKENQYQPFDGMVLTDTFQLYEQEKDMIADLLPDNSNRRTNQKKRDITVIIGNPPYSAKQTNADDSAANLSYPNLDERIRNTYVANTEAVNKNSLYDSYIRALRWASDRIGGDGVIGFVTNAGWIDGNATNGLRKCLVEEFSKIYVFNLRGNQRTLGELSRKEGGKIFGSGSRAPIAITILVKNKVSQESGKIFYHDIGDYLTREQKLEIISQYKSIAGIENANKFISIQPDEQNDWIEQSDKSFKKHLSLGIKKTSDPKCFYDYTNGVTTNRDAWCYNFSPKKLSKNCKQMIQFYDDCVNKFKSNSKDEIPKIVPIDRSKISWSSHLFQGISSNRIEDFSENHIRHSIYRPFTKTNLYYSRNFNDRRGITPKIFPEKNQPNKGIFINGIGTKIPFSTLMIDIIPDRNLMTAGQCFPLFIYNKEDLNNSLFSSIEKNQSSNIKDGMTDEIFELFKKTYSDKKFSKEDLFYYIYGLLHSTEYRDRFKNNFFRELPRIPPVKEFSDFIEFSKAGRLLGNLHTNYEKIEMYPVSYKEGSLSLATIENPRSFYRVEKMKFVKKDDKSKVFYNNHITIEEIPLEAYDYYVSGKPALEWVMERQVVTKDKASGIINDANDYANEVMNNPAYPLELFQRVITVSLETMKIVKSLPKLDID